MLKKKINQTKREKRKVGKKRRKSAKEKVKKKEMHYKLLL